MSKPIWIRLRSVLERDADATSVELSRESAEEMLAEIKRLTAEVAEYEAMFDAQWNADMAGVQMWREAHPGNDIVLPDRKRFTAWILAEIVVQRAENERLRAALESIADLPPGYADMRQDDLVVILANKARAALEEKP